MNREDHTRARVENGSAGGKRVRGARSGAKGPGHVGPEERAEGQGAKPIEARRSISRRLMRVEEEVLGTGDMLHHVDEIVGVQQRVVRSVQDSRIRGLLPVKAVSAPPASRGNPVSFPPPGGQAPVAPSNNHAIRSAGSAVGSSRNIRSADAGLLVEQGSLSGPGIAPEHW